MTHDSILVVSVNYGVRLRKKGKLIRRRSWDKVGIVRKSIDIYDLDRQERNYKRRGRVVKHVEDVEVWG